MCAVQTRPADIVTEDFLYLGLPVIEFAFELSTGAYGAYFGLGIPDSAEVQKSLQLAQLRNAQSGTSKLVRELVRQFDATIQVGTFRHSGENMQLMFASASLADVSSGVVAVTDDPFTLTTDEQDYLDLSNQMLVEPMSAGPECEEIVDEAVGTGDGTTGDASGDFSLDFKPLDHLDVSALTVAGVPFTPIAVGAAAAGNEVEVTDYVDSQPLAGDLQFFVGGVAADVTGDIVATYQPSHAFVENTDYVVDYKGGRIRMLNTESATDALKVNQPMRADYSYNEADHQLIKPFSQFIFAGRSRIRMLTDVGANLIWTIPKSQVRLTEDAFVFNRDDFTVTTLALQLLEDTTSATDPYGQMEVYREGTF
ncbi:MAG: hypothetical protein GY898_06110 [Proteobacteria bacterium]|nr:hypothetical protein [Pseudomonadota bacterium]